MHKRESEASEDVDWLLHEAVEAGVARGRYRQPDDDDLRSILTGLLRRRWARHAPSSSVASVPPRRWTTFGPGGRAADAGVRRGEAGRSG